MSGIFGQISKQNIHKRNIKILANYARRRGQDTSGLVYLSNGNYTISRTFNDIKKMMYNNKYTNSKVFFGQTKMITDTPPVAQPICRDDIILLHDGIVLNDKNLWNQIKMDSKYNIDSEVIIGIAIKYLENNPNLDYLSTHILSLCKGAISAVLILPKIGKVLLFSNDGNLFTGKIEQDVYFSSEKFSLEQIGCKNIEQIKGEGIVLDLPKSDSIDIIESKTVSVNYKSDFANRDYEESLLEFDQPDLRRCTICVLPETFPHISFDENGVCNYCNNYKKRGLKKSKKELFELVESYRINDGGRCIVPFSGGRDSCYALHIIVNELKLKPITYTYDWGMVTDYARRNISLMCSKLNVENVFVAANITKKRNNIRKNLKAWLKHPHLGMVSLLTAGDKHFFKYVEIVKKQTGINLNLWGTNPLETTHFKSGFLGIKPDFDGKQVYTTGFRKQMKYQWLRLKQMIRNPKYFNSSLFDTLSGEYYRSFTKKSDYFHIFDYYQWDENEVNKVLSDYGFEKAPDTNTTWRIGDGTAGFYNYVYYTVSGFSEHDTFRSNQIREGQITRDEALRLIYDENKPRYENIRWYLNILNMDYAKVIQRINSIPKLYKKQ